MMTPINNKCRRTSVLPLKVTVVVFSLLRFVHNASAQPAVVGQWGALQTNWPNVPIHVHVLPSGRVLFWGRRDQPTDSLDAQECTPQIWDPLSGAFTVLPQPTDITGKIKVNLFCSGHTFLADGRLLVVGGHHLDGQGIDQATIFDPKTLSWSPIDPMNAGRWYPTVIMLADGRAVVSSGDRLDGTVNPIQQIEANGHWTSIVDFQGLPLYPRMHLAPDGRIFMAGLLSQMVANNMFLGSYFLDVAANGGNGVWTPVNAPYPGPLRDYYPSVLYDVGKILVMGGGSPPIKTAQTIDLTAPGAAWTSVDDMHFPRRHHNATLLADGTILVTGGTQGPPPSDLGKPNVDPFDDLRNGMPVHTAELWDPVTGHWSIMADESADRCYHSTAVLLPDATVLSAGGGEFRPGVTTGLPENENLLQDSHRDAQIFSPSYLFRGGSRPEILSAPALVAYTQGFDVGIAQAAEIERVTWIRLSSVTHAFNSTQRFLSLAFTSTGNVLRVVAPPNANVSPPGYYMLFVIDKLGVPSVAKIVQIHSA